MADRIAIVGGGAAGFFAAIACARANPASEVSIYERGPEFLTKVRISGGGRCNVTHACFDPRVMSERYPRGERALISPLHRFSPRDTVAWFEERGVKLKTEADGRMFPVTDSSETIVDCLINEAKVAGVRFYLRQGVDAVRRTGASFELDLTSGLTVTADRLLLATGGTRSSGGAALASSLGHTLTPPVPSLFSFHIDAPWLRRLPGVAVADVEAAVPAHSLRERGPILVTHQGVSGPVILRLSAWGARELHGTDYKFTLRVNWLPDLNRDEIRARLDSLRHSNPNRLIVNSPLGPLPSRLWRELALLAGIAPETTWTHLSRPSALALVSLLAATALEVNGKSLNKEEFVTCGGVDLREVNFKTMESRIVSGLFFAGELLDVDGITGGFNFQAAWSTGWIAGNAMARPVAGSADPG